MEIRHGQLPADQRFPISQLHFIYLSPPSHLALVSQVPADCQMLCTVHCVLYHAPSIRRTRTIRASDIRLAGARSREHLLVDRSLRRHHRLLLRSLHDGSVVLSRIHGQLLLHSAIELGVRAVRPLQGLKEEEELVYIVNRRRV